MDIGSRIINRAPLRIGIDLGTTNSCCFYERNGSIIALHTDQGGYILPSCVDFHSDGKILVGTLAKTNLANGSSRSRVITNSKRIIGKNFDDPSVQQLIDYCGVPIENKGGKPVFRVDEGRFVTPKEVATEIIKKILQQVKQVCDQDPTQVCVTIPARFGHNERVLTRQAVIDAGIPEDIVVIQNEPTVAAICYGEDFAKEGSRRVLVYDLGGGTFDLSIVEINNGNYTVICHEGDPNLGGADFDRLILKWVETKYYNEFKQPLFLSSIPEKVKNRYINKYLSHIEEYKKTLSSSDSVDMTFEFIKKYKPESAAADDEDEFTFLMNIDDLNDIIKEKMDKTMQMIDSLLAKQNLTKSDIDSVILVGGSTRLRAVQQRLGEKFGNSKLKFNVNPDECVAKGACHYLVNKRNITEVTSKSLGYGLKDNRVLCLIPTQTRLPATYTTTTETSSDNQFVASSSVIQCYQEKAEDTMTIDNTCVKLHPLYWDGFQIRPAGEVKFLTTYTVDKYGILYVRVIEKETGKVLIDDLRVDVKEL